MMPRLTRYWFEFDIKASREARSMPWVGVTAWNLDDARQLVSDRLFNGQPLPPHTRLVEDVAIPDLDDNHVRRHMAPPNERGIWYPMGFQS